MTPLAVSIRPAGEDDIPFIMSVERMPGYVELVGSFSAAEHRRRLNEPGAIYYLCTQGTLPIGFAIIRLDNDGMGNAQLHRIAITPSGLGKGSAFLRELCNLAFTHHGAGRLWLDVLPSNLHAQHVYLKAGFAREGIMRAALRLGDGSRRDLVLMSLLLEDWQAANSAR